MAQGSLRAAAACMDIVEYRSSLSRYYYAAYQAVSALLLYQGLAPPLVRGEQREAWPHAATPDLFAEVLRKFIQSNARRNDLKSRLTRLYKLRLNADYVGSPEPSAITADSAASDAGYVVKVVGSILPDEVDK